MTSFAFVSARQLCIPDTLSSKHPNWYVLPESNFLYQECPWKLFSEESTKEAQV